MDTLRDRLVCSMRNEAVQKQLLTKEDLTFAMAQEWAETEERASKDAEQLDSRAQHTNFLGAMSTRSNLKVSFPMHVRKASFICSSATLVALKKCSSLSRYMYM